MRVVQRHGGDECYVLLESEGTLFAACPLPKEQPSSTAVEPVLDSSRYFVLRVVDVTNESGRGTSQHAYLGLGFKERSEASDFRAAVDDYARMIQREREAQETRQARERLEGSGEGTPARGPDLSLPPGQKISMTVPLKRREGGDGHGHGHGPSEKRKQASSGPLPPPPNPAAKSQGDASGGWARFEDDPEADSFGAFQAP